MALNITEEIRLPLDVRRLFLDPYSEEIPNDNLSKSGIYFRQIAITQDTMLFEKVTQNHSYDPNVRAYPDKKPSVQAHHVFVKIWEQMQLDERTNSTCHRAYWLGEAWQGDEIDPETVSDYLVKTLAERVKRFKKNVGMNQLIPFVPEIQALKPHTYRVGQSYREWFAENKRKSRFDWDVVTSLANGEKIQPITASAFGYTTPVITADEIARVVEEINSNPEPKLEVTNLEDNKDKFDLLASALTNLVEIQKQNQPPNNKKAN